MKRTLWRAIIVVALLANFLMVMPVAARVPPPDEPVAASSSQAAPAIAKPAPVAIGSVELQWPHLRAPREEIALSILTQEGVISRDSTQAEIQAALGNYYAKFYKHGEDWVDPQVEQFIQQREKELANPSATALAITPVTATVFAVAVQFSQTEALTVGTCITQAVVITGPMQGDMPFPAATDNNTLWYSPTLTADPKFYGKLVFGYEGVGRARYDLTDPDDGQPGINLAGYTVQDFYDNVAGTGNVNITGTVEGWVTVPHSEGYYGANDCTTDNDGGIVPVGQLVIDAMKVYSASHPTYYTDTSASAFWPKYDQNMDGLVDAFWLIHAGMDEAGGGGQQGPFAIWSHSWSLAAQGLTFKVYEGDPVTTTDDIYISPYTMQPENLDLGVTAEEFGHNFFGLPDLYTVDAQNSVGNWVGPMSSGSWMGWLGGTAPVGMPLWFRMIASYRGPGGTREPLNWQEPMVTRAYTDTAADITIGQLEKTPALVNKGVRINLPGIAENIPNNAGTGKGAFTPSANNADYRLTRSLAVGATATGTLTLNAYWDTEYGYDYGQVTINGQTISDTTGFMTEGGYGWGVTGQGGPETLRFDLSAYKGTTVTLALRLACDEGTNNPGFWADDVTLDGTVVDAFEGATVPGTFPGWTNDGNWQVVPVDKLYESYYLVEWRTKTHYDKMVKTAYMATDIDDSAILWRVERTPYNIPAALVYYRNQKYPGGYYQRSTYNDPPSYGPKNKLLIVDMNYQPMRIVPTSTTYLNSRASSYDAGLTLQPTERITLTKLYGITNPPGPYVFPSKPEVTQFSDALGYYAGFYYRNGYYYSNRDGSTVIPARGPYSTRITHFDLTPFPEMYEAPILDPYYWWGGTGNPGDDNMQYGVNVKLLSKAGDDAYNSTATLRFQDLAVLKNVSPSPADITAPGVYTFTYWVALNNTSLTPISGTITMTVPGGLNVVSYTPAPVSSWQGYSLAPSTWVTFTLVATTEVKAGDPVKVWTGSVNVDDGVNPVTSDVWTTAASLFTNPSIAPATGYATTYVGVPGQTALYRVTITNTSLYNSDTFTVTATTAPSSWPDYLLPAGAGMLEASAVPIVVGPIAPGATADVFVLVTIPSTVNLGDKATTTVIPTSVGDPTRTDSLTFTTMTLFKIFLPVIIK